MCFIVENSYIYYIWYFSGASWFCKHFDSLLIFSHFGGSSRNYHQFLSNVIPTARTARFTRMIFAAVLSPTIKIFHRHLGPNLLIFVVKVSPTFYGDFMTYHRHFTAKKHRPR
jgi:hypothetical protein